MLKTEAIVLSSMKYGETSLILQMYTRDEGRASFIIGGVRKAKSKVSAGMLQPGSLIYLTAYYKPGNRLNRIKEVKPSIIYQNIPFKLFKRGVCLFSIELLAKTILEQDANKDLFSFLREYFCYLDQTTDPIANLPIWFMRQLSIFYGFGPNDNYSELNNIFNLIDGSFTDKIPVHRHYILMPTSQLLFGILSLDLDNIHVMSIPRSDRNKLLRVLIDYFRVHIEGFKELNSQDVLAELFD